MKTILVIEDNQDIRENTIEILELNHFRVLSAENGRIGLELAKTHFPDLVLCDIMMPELDGYGVLSGLKSNERTSSIPFVFLTASVEKTDVETGLGMGAQGYIRKPFETDELFETIDSLIGKK